MSVLVVGSVALDSIETPFAVEKDAFGGSATHFALASSLLAETRLAANIGSDLPQEYIALLRDHGVDLAGLKVCDGKTFRWSGRYRSDMNVRETLAVHLNVFGAYPPDVPPQYADSDYLFLANGSPTHQLHVLDAMDGPAFSAVDTMDHWIESERDALAEVFKRIDAVVINDSEAQLLAGDSGLRGAHAILDMGPRYAVVKKGEHGAMMVGHDETFLIPAYPAARVSDPTGAGDSFAGGMMGYLARVGDTSPSALRQAIACGTVIASFNVEDFGVKRVAALTMDDVRKRLADFKAMTAF